MSTGPRGPAAFTGPSAAPRSSGLSDWLPVLAGVPLEGLSKRHLRGAAEGPVNAAGPLGPVDIGYSSSGTRRVYATTACRARDGRRWWRDSARPRGGVTHV